MAEGGAFRSVTIPTLFCINQRYAKHAAACIVSLLERNSWAFFDLVIVSTGDLGVEAAKLRRTLAAYPNCALKTVRFDARPHPRLPVRAHYSIDNYTRLWMAEFFPATVERILYLDSDMIVTGDIGGLWRAPLGEAIVGAVTIPGSTRCGALGIPEEYGYFNSGVLVIDLARWRCEEIFTRLIDYLAANGEKIVDADQDVLNACLYDRRLALPYVYNAISPFFFDHHPLGMSAEERADVCANARIVHFNGASKPWSYLCRHPNRADYWRYLAKTEWRDDEPEDRNFTNWAKKTLGPLMPAALRDYVRARLSARAAE
ncbi:MAG TPA: glycosyltransferase family 8 protein [Stellaceae bacterium]